MLRMTNFQPNKVVNSIFNFRLYLNSHLYFYIFHILKYILLYSTSFLVFQIMHIFLFSNHCISFGYPKGLPLRDAILSTYAGVVQHIRKCKYTHEEKTISSANI